MGLSKEEERIRDAALEQARKQKKAIAEELTNPEKFPPEENPVSVFMAGAPGAGKTEASIELIQDLEGDFGQVIRIDADELRTRFDGYTGRNSHLFHPAVSVLVEKIHDMALKQGQSFVLDGTLSNYERAEQNVRRSLKKDRIVQILYVYQEPRLAWEVVLRREAVEGRNIRPQDFVEQYFASRRVVNELKSRFGRRIWVDLLVKNTRHGVRAYEANIGRIDHHIPEKYTATEVRELVGLEGTE